MQALADPERVLALAYVPAGRRAALAALWALDERLSEVTLAAREPMLTRMRLVWWRDALAALDVRPPPGEPLLQALAAHVLPAGVSGAELAEMTEGWDALLPLDANDHAAREAHGRERGERLFALAGRLLGAAPPAGAGRRWALADIARKGQGAMPAAGASQWWPRPLRPLGMLAVLAGRDPAERQGSPARVARMLRHRLTGR